MVDNPFAVLDVSTRDDRHRIMAAAEERSLLLDADVCQRALADLLNLRRRLEAEFGWFPGASPGTASRAAASRTVESVEELPLTGLANANALLLAATSSQSQGAAALADFLRVMAQAVDAIGLDRLLTEVNEDRDVAGFAHVTSTELAEEVLAERRLAWRRGVMQVFDRSPAEAMAEALSAVVAEAAQHESFPHFLHDVVDDYALRTQPFLSFADTSAERLVKEARQLAAERPDALEPIIETLVKFLDRWRWVTAPMQVSYTIRGQTDDRSEEFALRVRSLWVDLCNDHALLREARTLAAAVRATIAGLPFLASKVEGDLSAIDALIEKSTERNSQLDYSAEIGTLIKSRLAISANGLEWKGRHYPLAQIRGARWGAVSHVSRGSPTRTDYDVGWTADGGTADVKLYKAEVFEAFTTRLWAALAQQMFEAIGQQLRAGAELPFGRAVIKDESVILRSTGLFSNKQAEFPWQEVTIGSQGGCFTIYGPKGANMMGVMLYREHDNVHFLEPMIRHAFKNGRSRLSEAFF